MLAPDVVNEYRPPPTRKKSQIRSTSFKLDPELLARLDAVVTLWKEHATARGDSVDDVTRSYVVRLLLEDGIAGAFENYGGMPQDEKAWARVRRAIQEQAKK